MWVTRAPTASAGSAPDGIITTFAGTGGPGRDGDGGPATEATLSLGGDPASLAIDASGSIYIGDSGNQVIRVIDSSGMISTLDVDELSPMRANDCPPPTAPHRS